ncbi:MAG: DUF4373 domain-containing protein [Fibrobacterota bacterium]|nr:DUF4373 domain-containing protein [Fibrobacterota bacterium]
MGRPHSDGLEYFEHDVDASNDEKIESMEALYGSAGYAFYFKMAERIYRAGGMLLVSDAEIRQILARKCLCAVDEWSKMLASALKIGLFDAKIYDTTCAITSNGIQKRCQKVFDKRQKMAFKYQNRVSAAETPPETPLVEKSRVEKSRVEIKKKKTAKAILGVVEAGNLMPAKRDPENIEATKALIKPRKVSTRIPEDWTLPAGMVEWCAENNLPGPEYQRPIFIDYWRSKGEARADWPATFRNWMRSPYRKDEAINAKNGSSGRSSSAFESAAQRNARKLRANLGLDESPGDYQTATSGFLSVLPSGTTGVGHV